MLTQCGLSQPTDAEIDAVMPGSKAIGGFGWMICVCDVFSVMLVMLVGSPPEVVGLFCGMFWDSVPLTGKNLKTIIRYL